MELRGRIARGLQHAPGPCAATWACRAAGRWALPLRPRWSRHEPASVSMRFEQDHGVWPGNQDTALQARWMSQLRNRAAIFGKWLKGFYCSAELRSAEQLPLRYESMQTFPVKGQRPLKDRSIAQIKALAHQSVKWKNHGVANGVAAVQTSPQPHLHLVPREGCRRRSAQRHGAHALHLTPCVHGVQRGPQPYQDHKTSASQ